MPPLRLDALVCAVPGVEVFSQFIQHRGLRCLASHGETASFKDGANHFWRQRGELSYLGLDL